MASNSDKPIQIAIIASQWMVAKIVEAVMEHNNLHVLESLECEEQQVSEFIPSVCNLKPGWIILAYYWNLEINDRFARQIKSLSPNIKVAGMDIVAQSHDTAKFLDYVHFYPLAVKHIEDAIRALSNEKS